MIANFDIETVHKLVPRDREKNLRFRRKLLEEARANVGLQAKLIEICRGNILFWVNSFVWTFDPRHADPGKREVPWICYPFQEEALVELKSAIGRYDLTMEKSRDQGATWMCVLAFDHCFLFDDNSSFMCVSRNEDLVDKTEDSDAIFWKFDYVHRFLPAWMLDPSDLNRSDKHIFNRRTRSTVDGAATTSGMGAGGRRTGFFLDEFSRFPVEAGFDCIASTQYTTRSRIFNGTPNGRMNAHYRINHPPSKTRKLRFEWKDHPVQNRGKYTVDKNLLKIIDHEFWRTATMGDLRGMCPALMDDFDKAQESHVDDDALAKGLYPFNKDGKLRAPYYDEECCRTPIPTQISQELDVDYLGSGDPIMSSADIIRVKELYARPPILRGTIKFDETTGVFEEFIEDDRGVLELWIRPSAFGTIPKDRSYVAGVDISLGSRRSNSVIVVADIDTKECVAEYAYNDIGPDDFARCAYALCHWFNMALIIWEENGVGNAFYASLRRLGYGNFWVRTSEGTVKRKRGTKYGYVVQGTGKKTLLLNAVAAMKRGEYINRSASAIAEFGCYQHCGPTVQHISDGAGGDDPDNHGDKAVGHSLVNHVLKDVVTNAGRPAVVPPNCLFNRRKEWEKRDKDNAEYRWAV